MASIVTCFRKISTGITSIIRSLTFGKYQTGFYFKRKQEYASLGATIFTLIGLLLFFGFSIIVMKDALN